jgi:hypothetical protein
LSTIENINSFPENHKTLTRQEIVKMLYLASGYIAEHGPKTMSAILDNVALATHDY